MKKKTLKELEYDVAFFQTRYDEEQKKRWQIESELKQEREKQPRDWQQTNHSLQDTNNQLFEIIRWLVSPETAKDPFARKAQTHHSNGLG
jgi:hypothetical protein